jgi:hypothetical protein
MPISLILEVDKLTDMFTKFKIAIINMNMEMAERAKIIFSTSRLCCREDNNPVIKQDRVSGQPQSEDLHSVL